MNQSVNLSAVPDVTMRGGASPYAPRPAVTVGRLAGLIRDLSARPGAWWRLARFDGTPVRIPGDHELWLTAWPPGHRAAPAAEVFTVLAGELYERTLTGRGVAEHALRANRIRVYGGADPHELVNHGPAYALTLHATRR